MKSEDAKHLAESGTKDPVKYVIFITDGVNNSTGADTASINSCRAMTAAGVEVYAVGFALEPGTYSFNGQGGWTMPQHMSDRAYNFLESCASSPDHFIKAVNTSSLDIAFEKIGKSIAKDAIRISG